MHVWPALSHLPQAILRPATVMLASSHTMQGLCVCVCVCEVCVCVCVLCESVLCMLNSSYESTETVITVIRAMNDGYSPQPTSDLSKCGV